MAKLDILTYPDGFLLKPTLPVENIDGNLQKFIDDMADTMFDAPGVGLAAIQVGSNQSLLIYDDAPGEAIQSYNAIINPQIVDSQGEILSENEGCLSVPDFRADVKRSATVLVEGYDRDGKPLQIEANGFLAIVLQHEIDHLNGTLFIERISALKRQLYKRRVKKMMRNQ
jgi:peptide deformylase